MAGEGASILKLLGGTECKDLNRSLRNYLEPLFGHPASGKKRNAKIDLRALAKEYVPFLAQLLKICEAKLTALPLKGDNVTNNMADEIFSAMTLAIDGLDALRSQLAGSPVEIERQRCGLVRRLINWKRHSAALSQSQLLFRSLCQLTAIPETKSSAVSKAGSGRMSTKDAIKMRPPSSNLPPSDDLVLAPPREVHLTPELPAIVVTAAIDFIWCITESYENSSFQIAARLPQQLTPWLSVLDPGAASKQRDALYRAIYKCSSILLANLTKFEADLVEQFCFLTLGLCASSSQCDQYAMTAKKLCSSLSGQDPEWSKKAVDICATAFNELHSRSENALQLREAWHSDEVLDLVEWFARTCQTSNKVEKGWLQLCKIVDHVKEASPGAPVLITGLYAVGLVLLQADSYPEIIDMESGGRATRSLGCLPEVKDFFLEASFMLRGVEGYLKLLLDQAPDSAGKIVEKSVSRSTSKAGSGTLEVAGKVAVSVARTLLYAQKVFTKYAQALWNTHSARSSENESSRRSFNSDLRKVLQLFYPVIEKGLRYEHLSDYETEIFSKGLQAALQASLAALRLSLLLEDGVQESVNLLSKIMHHLQLEEQSWLMSSTYNIGVQLFNNKQHSLACWPLGLAHRVAWVTANSRYSDTKRGALASDSVSEACAKCAVLANAHDRNGEPEKSKLTLVDGILRWARVAVQTPKTTLPHALVKSLVKLKCLGNHSLHYKNGEVESLYIFLRDCQPSLPAAIVGLLLEEEHAACEAMENQFPDICHTLKKRIMEYLLHNVYTGEGFVLEKSLVLMKRCRSLRIYGAENLPSCIECISEAVSSLEGAMKIRGKVTGDLWVLPSLKKQLALAYAIKGICSYENNHSCPEFLPNIVLSLNMWRSVLESHTKCKGLPELESNLRPATYEHESIVLLLYINDLLAIQGYTVLCSEAQDLILKVLLNSRLSSTAEWMTLLMNGQRGHFICTETFPGDVLLSVRQSLDATAKPDEFWRKYFDLFPGSLLEAYHRLAPDCSDTLHKASDSRNSTIKGLEGFRQIKDIVHARLSTGDKSSQFVLRTADLCHLISQLAYENGDTQEAMKYAKDAFRLRARLFKCMFDAPAKRSVDVNDHTLSTSAREKPKGLLLKEYAGTFGTLSWAGSATSQSWLSNPSPWRVLGDYVESLMQMGSIYERMGAVDQAERSFKEGHRLCSMQNLPMAQAAFSLNLGEMQRKRQLWEIAEGEFAHAKQLFDTLQADQSCESCILVGKASLDLRIGDLVRHRCYGQPPGRTKDIGSHSNGFDQKSSQTLSDALLNYAAAATSLAPLLKNTGAQCDIEKQRFETSHETQMTVLRSLQKKGKTVSLQIMSDEVEETDTSASSGGKSWVRKNTKSSSSSLHEVENAILRNDISSLCKDMSLASLTSKERVSSHVHHKRSRSVHGRKAGLRSQTRTKGMATLEEEVSVTNHLEDRTTTMQTSLCAERNVELRMDEEIDSLKVTEGGKFLMHSKTTLCSSFEQWSSYRRTHLARRLMSRVFLQRGKCYIHLEAFDEAVHNFEQAMHMLEVLAVVQLGETDAGRSLFPVEEGAIIYHLSKVWLQRGHLGGLASCVDQSATGGCDDSETVKLQSISRLCLAFSLCQQVPLLFHKIAKVLAILLVPNVWGGPQASSFSHLTMQEMTEVAAYFHQASLGTATRQQHLAVLDSKLDELSLEGSQQQQEICLGKMQEALRLGPINLENMGLRARQFWDCLPCLSACCISFVSMEDVNMLRGNQSPLAGSGVCDTSNDCLLVTRIGFKSKPVVVLLPVAPLEYLRNDANKLTSRMSTSNPYNLSDDEDMDSNNPDEEPKSPPSAGLNHLQVNRPTVLQRVAAEFGSVLDESRLSTSGTRPVDTLEEKSAWWKWRMELDTRLSVLLRVAEDSWLGPFKCLLLGEPQAPMTKTFELCTVHLVEMMGSIISQRRPSPIDDGLVKCLLQAVGSLTTFELERAIAEMLGFYDFSCCEAHQNECKSGCKNCHWKMTQAEEYEEIRKVYISFRTMYIVSTQQSENDVLKCLTDESSSKRRSKRQTKSKASNNRSPLEIIAQMASDCPHELDAPVKRQPVQLILDSDAQALPWESLPILRDQEVYRMPSLGTLHAVSIQRQSHRFSDMRKVPSCDDSPIVNGAKVKNPKSSSASVSKDFISDECLELTCVNPYNTFYVLNPNGDLPSTQAAFEDWFTQQPGWKGKAGAVPTAEEYQMGLQNHDLFVYLGHGSGDQFLPERYVRELDHCAASLLMGCSSGRLALRGEYQPFGVVLSYLMAGCPAVIANLWDVTDGDIDRFSRSLLHSWLGSTQEAESSADSSSKGPGSGPRPRDMGDYEVAMRALRGMDGATNAKRVNRVDGPLSENQEEIHQVGTQDMHRLGSAMGQSRNACRLPHLIGASPVCYGMPTGLWKQV